MVFVMKLQYLRPKLYFVKAFDVVNCVLILLTNNVHRPLVLFCLHKHMTFVKSEYIFFVLQSNFFTNKTNKYV